VDQVPLRLPDGLFWCQAVAVNTLLQQARPDATFVGPLRHGLGQAECGNPTRPAVVAGLLARAGPPAVLRTVRAVVVTAIDSVSRTRLWSHVAQKCLKAIPPPIANGDAATSVGRVTRVSRVVASADDVKPGLVKWMLGHIALGTNGRRVDASTGLRVGASQIARAGFNITPAVALASPEANGLTSINSRWEFFGNRQPPKPLADKVKRIWCAVSAWHEADVVFVKTTFKGF
jgi:hypothetical protein